MYDLGGQRTARPCPAVIARQFFSRIYILCKQSVARRRAINKIKKGFSNDYKRKNDDAGELRVCLQHDEACRKHRELRLTLKYQERGYEKYRSCFRYKQTGELIEIVYPVWTEKDNA